MPDADFGSGGIFTTDLGPGNDYGYSLAVQADGKIIIAGSNSLKVGIARLHPNGVVDSSFGTNGIVADVYGNARYVDVAPDGKIVLGGTATAAQDYALMAMRYLANGILDTSFNHTGIAYTIAGEVRSNFGRAVKVQPDGKVLVAGTGGFGGQGANFVLVRYNIDGQPDASFGSGGIANVDFEHSNDDAWGMCLASDGKIVLAGMTGANIDFAIARMNANGTLDNLFGNDGRIITPVREKNDYARGVALQADGRLVVAGMSYADKGSGSYSDPAVARYTSYPSDIAHTAGIAATPLLYPNPASQWLYISVPQGQKVANVRFMDMSGRKLDVFSSGQNGPFDVSSLQAGEYIVNITYGNGVTATQKIGIQ